MKKSEPVDLSIPRRPAIAFLAINLVRFTWRFVRQIWPLLVLYLIDPGQVAGIFLILAVVVVIGISAVSSILAFYHFDYCIADNALSIRSGVVKRVEQSIPFERIQSVQIEEPAVHRLFSVVRFKIETAGSKEEEGLIEALEPHIAEQLKTAIETERKAILKTKDPELEEEKAAITEDIINQLSIAQLIKIGIARNHLRTALILLGLTLGFLDNITEFFPEAWTSEWGQQLQALFQWNPVIIASLFAVFIIVSTIITLVTTFFLYYNQRFIVKGDYWIIRSGLVSRREWNVPLKKVQEIAFSQNPMQSAFSFGELRIKTASADEIGDDQLIVLPGVEHQFYTKLIQIHSGEETIENQFTPVYVYRWRLWFFWGIIPALLILAVPFSTLTVKAAVAIAYVILSYFWTGAVYKNYRLSEGAKSVRIVKGYGWWSDRWVLWHKSQALQLSQGVYEQRKNLATLGVSHGAGTVYFPFMNRSEVTDIVNRGLYRIDQSSDEWI